jgi:hypothetical protein
LKLVFSLFEIFLKHCDIISFVLEKQKHASKLKLLTFFLVGYPETECQPPRCPKCGRTFGKVRFGIRVFGLGDIVSRFKKMGGSQYGC